MCREPVSKVDRGRLERFKLLLLYATNGLQTINEPLKFSLVILVGMNDHTTGVLYPPDRQRLSEALFTVWRTNKCHSGFDVCSMTNDRCILAQRLLIGGLKARS